MDDIELESNQIEVRKMTFIIRSWNGRTIRQREDGYMSLTDMAQSCGKDYYEWSRLTKTKAYLDALSKKQHTGNARLLIETIKDGDIELEGNQIEGIKMSFIIRSWNGRTIRQREDGYLSLTDMAQACGKEFRDWNRLDGSKRYIEALSSDVGICTSQLIEIRKGNTSEYEQGTWGHRKVAIRFAQWCSDEFAVQVDTWIEELLTKFRMIPQTLNPGGAVSLFSK